MRDRCGIGPGRDVRNELTTDGITVIEPLSGATVNATSLACLVGNNPANAFTLNTSNSLRALLGAALAFGAVLPRRPGLPAHRPL